MEVALLVTTGIVLMILKPTGIEYHYLCCILCTIKYHVHLHALFHCTQCIEHKTFNKVFYSTICQPVNYPQMEHPSKTIESGFATICEDSSSCSFFKCDFDFAIRRQGSPFSASSFPVGRGASSLLNTSCTSVSLSRRHMSHDSPKYQRSINVAF